jgi:hypothetical protein
MERHQRFTVRGRPLSFIVATLGRLMNQANDADQQDIHEKRECRDSPKPCFGDRRSIGVRGTK